MFSKTTHWGSKTHIFAEKQLAGLMKPCREKLNKTMIIGWQLVRITVVVAISLSVGT